MLHFPTDKHILPNLPWGMVQRRITLQQAAVMDQDFCVETIHGTMSSRCGDALMEGSRGQLYTIAESAYNLHYGPVVSIEELALAIYAAVAGLEITQEVRKQFEQIEVKSPWITAASRVYRMLATPTTSIPLF